MTLRLIAHNTLWLTSAEVVIKLIALVFNFILVRLISVSNYGDYSLINAFVAIFSFLPDLGVSLIAIRDLATHPRRYSQLIGQVFIINLAFSCIAFATIMALFPVYARSSSHLPLIALAAATLVITSLRTVAKLGFDASESMHISAIFTVINSVFSALGSLVGFILLPGLIGLFLGNLAGASLSLILEWGIAVKFFRWPSLSLALSSLFPLIKSGLPLSLAAATALLSSRLDTLILGRWLTSREVGWYVAAQILVFSAIQLFNVPVMIATYPALTKAQNSKVKFKQLITTLITFILSWTGLFMLGTWALARPVLTLTFGAAYLPAVPALKLLSLLVPFAALSALLYKLLIILKREAIYFKISLVGLAINLTINLILIPRLGIVGAAMSAVITHLSLFLLYGYHVKLLLRQL